MPDYIIDSEGYFTVPEMKAHPGEKINFNIAPDYNKRARKGAIVLVLKDSKSTHDDSPLVGGKYSEGLIQSFELSGASTITLLVKGNAAKGEWVLIPPGSNRGEGKSGTLVIAG